MWYVEKCTAILQNLRGDFESIGFIMNPYDPCVANKMINVSQVTITWQVDDLKISHKDGWERKNMW